MPFPLCCFLSKCHAAIYVWQCVTDRQVLLGSDVLAEFLELVRLMCQDANSSHFGAPVAPVGRGGVAVKLGIEERHRAREGLSFRDPGARLP